MKGLKFAALSALLVIGALVANSADKKVSDLTTLAQGDWATGDLFNIVDVSAGSSKKTTVADFDLRFFKLSDVLSVPQGGTGLASGTSGGILGFTASTTIASSGVLAANQVMIGGGAGALPSTLAAGAQYSVFRMGASTPAYGSINLDQAAAVTGVLPNANTTATSNNTISTIVARDGSGNFSAGTISAALTGNSSTATALASNPSDCASDTYANAIAASGNLTCGAITNAATTATSANTNSAIVARDGSGNFSAGTISAALTGTASGNTTYTANQYGVVLSGSANAMSVLAPDSSTLKFLKSGGTGANPTWAVPSPTYAVTSKTTTYAIDAADNIILCSGSAFTVTLPTAVGATGKVYVVKKTDATLGNIITIATTSSQTIDGVTTRTLNTKDESWTLVSDGANWHAVDHKIPSYLTSYTPGGAWSTNTTITGTWKRNGSNIEIECLILISGAGAPDTATATCNIPSGLTIAGLLSTLSTGVARGFGVAVDSGSNNYPVGVWYNSNVSVTPFYNIASGTYLTGGFVTQALPFVFGQNDQIQLWFTVPISGWEG